MAAKQADRAKRVGIWIRVSTEDQVKGESPEHHEKRARLYAEAKGWQVVETYRLDAISGKTVKETPEAQRMLKDIREGHITGLIFSKLARLARNTKELLEFSEIFRETGADLISLAESIDTSTPAGRLFYTMIAGMAQWEREEIAERVAASVPIRAKLGKPTGGKAIYGYQWKDGKFIPDPVEAPIRRLVYELFAEHKRLRTVARLLNDRGYRTRNGKKFSDSTVLRLITDSAAKGRRRANYTTSKDNKGAWDLKPESEWVYQEVEAIVPEALWEECNALVAVRKAKGSKPVSKKTAHLFAGYTFCECGPPMYVLWKSPNYTCRACRNKIAANDLETVFHEQIKAFVFSDTEIAAHLEKVHAEIGEKAKLVSVLETEKSKLTTEIDKLYALYQSDAIDKDGFGCKYRPLAERQQQLDDEIPEAQAALDILKMAEISQAEVVHEARDLYSRWPELPVEEKRRIVEAIVERITIGVDEVDIQLFYGPPSPASCSIPATGSEGASPPPTHHYVARGNPWEMATQPQGFIAATRMNRAGKSTWRAARDTVMCPESSGSRNASSTLRSNSGNSSRNNTPCIANEISPGRGCPPPPTSAAAEALWCGARNGLCRQCSTRNPAVPRDCTAADSNASVSVIAGRMPGSRAASIDFPVPGGPMSKME